VTAADLIREEGSLKVIKRGLQHMTEGRSAFRDPRNVRAD
jgi:hypothetical protein